MAAVAPLAPAALAAAVLTAGASLPVAWPLPRDAAALATAAATIAALAAAALSTAALAAATIAATGSSPQQSACGPLLQIWFAHLPAVLHTFQPWGLARSFFWPLASGVPVKPGPRRTCSSE